MNSSHKKTEEYFNDDSRRKKVNAVGRSDLKRIKFECDTRSCDLTLFTTSSDRQEICMKAGSCCVKIDDLANMDNSWHR